MRTINSYDISSAVLMNVPHLASVLPKDVYDALVAARDNESSERGRFILDQLVRNADLAREDHVPISQDTGALWACLEVGPDVELDGDVFIGVNEAMASASKTARLRNSIVRDALFDRTNTGNNAPVIREMHYTDRPGARLQLMLKDGGSDNASRVVMLKPNDGKQGVIDAVLDCVREQAANACAPLVVGVGVGLTFDKVGTLAKRALMRPFDVPSAHPEWEEFEQELLAAINATGIGPAGLGGDTTALAVRVMCAPCHISSLPVAVNLNGSAMRRITVEL